MLLGNSFFLTSEYIQSLAITFGFPKGEPCCAILLFALPSLQPS